ncbi:hypothetical protein DPEC_G00163770 [Dallia pectoralis]|uniref:Uncharacterized protein n=1 Tax=Dallia pectoralis TaxID=75939 RepID=A0ACC2GHA9_DALPE|nr:hypothetical protein DPEC_G00163770 [Dallia pectoralis]
MHEFKVNEEERHKDKRVLGVEQNTEQPSSITLAGCTEATANPNEGRNFNPPCPWPRWRIKRKVTAAWISVAVGADRYTPPCLRGHGKHDGQIQMEGRLD